MSDGGFDPLITADARRAVWATISGYIATDLRDQPGFEDGARMALDYALMDDPPREWPAGSFGHQIAKGGAPPWVDR
jgi:hypothetical protein